MRKIIVIFLLSFLIINVGAKEQNPKYKIIANSDKQEDIDEIYKIKNQLLLDYKEWIKSIDDKEQALYDHQIDYNAVYKNGIYLIKIGKAEGKELNGTLKVNFCESTEDIEQKSLIWDFLF